MLLRLIRLSLGLVMGGLPLAIRADATYWPLRNGALLQDWTNAALITANDNWGGVPSIVGFLGADLTTSTGVNPRTILTASGQGDVDVIANQTNPSSLSSGGVAEFDGLANPTIALQGSNTADAPHVVLHLDTTGRRAVTVSYLLRDLDGSADDAVQAVALQYRVGESGPFVDVPSAFVADATTGPSAATLATPVSVVLPAAAENQAQVQVRILTANAAGNDEWVGIDDLRVTSDGAGPGVVVEPTGGPLALSEGGGTATYTVRLASVPAGPVTLAVSAGTQLEVSVGGAFGSLLSLTLDSTTPRTVTVRAVDDLVFEDGHAGVLTHAITATGDAAAYPTTLTIPSLTVTLADNDAPTDATRISAIQGSGAASPLVGATVQVAAVVTGFVTGASGARDGFFLQEEDADVDLLPETSEGVFVYTAQTPGLAGTVAGLATGDAVIVVGRVVEFNGLTELTTENLTVARVERTGAGGPLPAPARLRFPAESPTAWERFEGMRVTIPERMTVSGNENLGQFGELVLSSGGRLVMPTNEIDPNDDPATGTASTGAGNVAAVTARVAQQTLRRIVLDDGSTRSFPVPTPHLSGADPATATRRAGDTVTGLTGVLSYGFGSYRIHPEGPVGFEAANPRTALPPLLGGSLTVASFNVLNYFVTFGGANDRGASNAAEFDRQRAKIVAALRALDADVVGLIEIQNRADGGAVTNETAVNDLVAALNAAYGTAGTYAAVPAPAAGTGTDFIRNALIYKPARVTPVGSPLADTDPVFQRPPLAQRFARSGGGAGVIVCVNHFRAKTSGSGADADQGDGQGANNATRRAQAQRLVAFLDATKATTGENDVLIMGDLNAYAEEDPVDVLRAAGYVDLLQRFAPAPRYSYVFEAAAGYLDHALASPSLVPQVAGAAAWAINADEPEFLDYNLELNPSNPGAGLKNDTQRATNAGTPYRSSDHDPVLVGLRLADGAVAAAPALRRQPAAQAVALGGSATFSVEPEDLQAGLSFQWEFNGKPLAGASGPALTVPAVGLAQAGLYAVRVAGPGGVTLSRPAVLGVLSSAKVAGGGVEVAADLRHPNGNVYDQILLTGSAAVVTADPGQVTRLSFIDLTDDIVQVEFAGPGSLTVVLESVSGPSFPINYNQAVGYLRGHARVILAGAGEGTNVSLFSVGRANAVNQALFRPEVAYDGLADVAYLAVASGDGRFGGARTSNASYFAAAGPTGLVAPGVTFTGPAFVGDIAAFDGAMAMLLLGGGDDVRVAGGDLAQPNGRPVHVGGVAQLRFTAGTNSHGVLLPARRNQAVLEENGVDVTARVVVNPPE